MHILLTDPDFPAPKPPAPKAHTTYPPTAVFVIIDLVTPTRAVHSELQSAFTDAQAFRFPDDLLILVYEDSSETSLLDVLTATGLSIP